MKLRDGERENEGEKGRENEGERGRENKGERQRQREREMTVEKCSTINPSV